MGIYVNPGNTDFVRSVNDYIYIDKTDLITVTNDRLGRSSCFLCVSRPRRFGKSMAADMLSAYYSRGCDSKELFCDRKIAGCDSFERHLNQHNVIRLDIQAFLSDPSGHPSFMEDLRSAVLKELMSTFPDCDSLDPAMTLRSAFNEIFSKTGEMFLFILDEWDCVFRIARDDEELQKRYLDFLRNTFKGAVYVELVYMTGILPIKKYGEHSAVNMFEEFSMTDPDILNRYFGFTEEEVRTECAARAVDFDEIQKWYDGYDLNGLHIYNPKSVNDALRRGKIQSYWTGTETYEALKVYIERNFDGLREAVISMLGGGACRIDVTSFQNDMTTFHSKDDVLTLLVHLGYLTYNAKERSVSIPNLEIEQEFIRAIRNGHGWDGLMHVLERSAKLLEATWSLDGDTVAAIMEANHSETASVIRYNDENSLACTVLMAYYSAKAYYADPIMEMPTGNGRADIVYLPLRSADRPALVVELKWNQSAVGAIRQIKDRKYAKWVESYTGDILLVGINYDKRSKKHTCLIEKYTCMPDV